MIKICNVSKSFNQQKVLNNVSYSFPDKGLFAICGPSGCGKSTFLNIVSGLLKPDSGDIIHQNQNLYQMDENSISEYRIKNFGFVFQDFKLFEGESVSGNILLPLESTSLLSSKAKKRKCQDLLSLVELNNMLDKNVMNLSGGEKQRVAIARSLVNNPNVIFADEPTGSLDEKNSIKIMEILKRVSTYSLVVVVSHDYSLMEHYSNQIIHMEDGEIKKIEELSSIEDKKFLPIKMEKRRIKKTSLPTSFLLKRFFRKIKEKKWQTALCNVAMSLSLVGVGASISLTSSISSNIKKVYSDIIGDNRIIMSLNESDVYTSVYSITSTEAEDLKETYSKYVKGIGVTYYNSFEYFFPHANEFNAVCDNKKITIDGLSVRDINEYTWLEDSDVTVYPKTISKVSNNELILGLTIEMVEDICYQLTIPRTVKSLSEYFENNAFDLVLEIENVDWGYYNEVMFRARGFTLEKEPKIYHSSHFWNEYVFEKEFKLPSTDFISGQASKPWILKKIYYLKMASKVEDFLKIAFNNRKSQNYIFEIANKNYYPNLMKNIEPSNSDRVLVFNDKRACIPSRAQIIVEENFSMIENPIYSTNGGYSIYSTSFLSGFSNFTYFSNDEEKLNDVINTLTSYSSKNNEKEELPSNVASGHYSKSLTGGVTFLPLNTVHFNSLNEVFISTSLKEKLFKSMDPIGKKIYVASITSESTLSDEKVRKNVENSELIVKGVYPSEKDVIYQNSDWSILYFQVYLKASIFSLGANCISYEIKDKKLNDEVINKLNKSIKEYTFFDPLKDFNMGVDETCNFIRIALIIFSISSIIISILLLSTCSYLHVIENKKEIGLARCLGIKRWESTKFLFSYSVLTGGISFVLSAVELIGITIFSSFYISQSLGGGGTFVFNPLSLLIMFMMAMVISLGSSFIFSFKIVNLEPLSALKV